VIEDRCSVEKHGRQRCYEHDTFKKKKKKKKKKLNRSSALTNFINIHQIKVKDGDN